MPEERNQIHPCKWCDQDIAFLITKKGKKMPVDAESLSEDDVAVLEQGESVDFRWGDHISHFGTCVEYKKQHQAAKAGGEDNGGNSEGA